MESISKKTVLRSLAIGVTLLGSNLFLSSTTFAGDINQKTKLHAQQEMSMSDKPASISAFAQREFKNYVNALSKADLSDTPLQLSKISDLKNAKLAYGFEVFTINPEDILDGRRELKTIVQGTGTWRFVIKVDGMAVGLMTVEKINGKWEASSFGGANLAKDVDSKMDMYSNADRSNMRFVRVFQAQADFMEISKASEGTVQFSPLKSAQVNLNLSEKAVASSSAKGLSMMSQKSELLDSRELLEPLRASVKRHLNVN